MVTKYCYSESEITSSNCLIHFILILHILIFQVCFITLKLENTYLTLLWRNILQQQRQITCFRSSSGNKAHTIQSYASFRCQANKMMKALNVECKMQESPIC